MALVRCLEVPRRTVVIHLMVVEPGKERGQKQKDRTRGQARSLEDGRTHATLSPPSCRRVKRRQSSAKCSIERIEREHDIVFSKIDVEFRRGRRDFGEVDALQGERLEDAIEHPGGGELLRLLILHPEVTIAGVSSRRLAGKPVARAHPNLRGVTDLRFCQPDDLPESDLLFLALPHGQALQERGVLALSAGKSVLRLLPPLVLTAEEASEVGGKLAEVLCASDE